MVRTCWGNYNWKEALNRYIELVPDGNWKKEQLLVYRYNDMGHIGVILLTLGFALLTLVGAIISFASRDWEPGFFCLFCTAMFMPLGVMFLLYTIRCVLIFYPGGLVYRNLRGEVFAVTDEDVLYVKTFGYGKYRNFDIKAKEITITWSVNAGRYWEAERYALGRYPDWNSYEMKNKP